MLTWLYVCVCVDLQSTWRESVFYLRCQGCCFPCLLEFVYVFALLHSQCVPPTTSCKIHLFLSTKVFFFSWLYVKPQEVKKWRVLILLLYTLIQLFWINSVKIHSSLRNIALPSFVAHACYLVIYIFFLSRIYQYLFLLKIFCTFLKHA